MCGLKATAAVYVTYDNQYHEPLEALNFGVKVGERVVSSAWCSGPDSPSGYLFLKMVLVPVDESVDVPVAFKMYSCPQRPFA